MLLQQRPPRRLERSVERPLGLGEANQQCNGAGEARNGARARHRAASEGEIEKVALRPPAFAVTVVLAQNGHTLRVRCAHAMRVQEGAEAFGGDGAVATVERSEEIAQFAARGFAETAPNVRDALVALVCPLH